MKWVESTTPSDLFIQAIHDEGQRVNMEIKVNRRI